MSTGILRPLDHLAPDAARRLVGARYGVILLPMRPAPMTASLTVMMTRLLGGL